MDIGFRLLHDYLLLFAMVNVVGNLPILAELTRGMADGERRRAYRVAVATACGIVVGFAVFGDWMLRAVFQVDVAAFRIAGGILVFAVAARGVLMGPRLRLREEENYEHVAVFPMGFPFLAGPGTIVTTILLMQAEGRFLTASAAGLVYGTVLMLLPLTQVIERAVGRVGVLVVSRILHVFIAAKATAFILDGLRSALAG